MNVPWEMFGRVAAAAALSALVGVERDRHGRPAGLRTHMVVGMASATYMVISIHFLDRGEGPPAAIGGTDLSKIASSVVTGIGFLGGGAILRTGLTLHGLTTAAGLWMVGAIGMAAGCGQFALATFVTALGLLLLGALRPLENRAVDRNSLHVVIAVAASAGAAEVESRLRALGGDLDRTAMRREVSDGIVELEYDLRLPKKVDTPRVVDALSDLAGLRFVRCESLQ